MAEKTGSRTGLIHRYIELGRVCLLMHLYEEANDLFGKSLEILSTVLRPSQKRGALISITLLLLVKGDIENALKAVSEAYQIQGAISSSEVTALYGVVSSLETDITHARTLYLESIEQADSLLRVSQLQFEPHYSQGVAYSGLSLHSQGLEREKYIELAFSAFKAALTTCNGTGMIQYFGLLRIVPLRLIDKDGILTPLIVLLENGKV